MAVHQDLIWVLVYGGVQIKKRATLKLMPILILLFLLIVALTMQGFAITFMMKVVQN